MAFPERAVQSLVRAFQRGTSTLFQVNNVLEYKMVDVSAIEPFLDDPDIMVRRHAAHVVAKRGNADKVIQAIVVEKDMGTRLYMLDVLGSQSADYYPLYGLINDEDLVIRETALQLFRRAKADDPIFTLLFSEDDVQVSRAKRYLNAKT